MNGFTGHREVYDGHCPQCNLYYANVRKDTGDMTFDDYQILARQTAIYPDAGEGNVKARNYCVVGLLGETGTIANIWDKVLRDGYTDDSIVRLVQQMGDALWYLSQLAHELGVPFDDIALLNIAKLEDRMNRGVLRGSGEYR